MKLYEKESVQYAIKSAEYISHFKLIQDIRDIIVGQYGTNWQETLFGKKD